MYSPANPAPTTTTSTRSFPIASSPAWIATIITAIYFLVSRKLPALVRRPVLYGILYGIVCYFVMSFVVIPLSNAGVPGRGLHWPEWPVLVNGIVGHALLVGLPAALWVSRAGEPAR